MPVKRKRAAGARAKTTKQEAEPAQVSGEPLIDLGPLVRCTVVQRPSVRNKSPYVADVIVSTTNKVAVTHVPNIDSGGKLRKGAAILASKVPNVDENTLGKFGTPKCEYICRLLRCEEDEHDGGGVWISANPALGEQLARKLLEKGALDDRLGPSAVVKGSIQTQKMLKRQVTESVSNAYRPDFSVTHEDGSVTILEVKQVVDSDYSRAFVHARAETQAPHPAYSPNCPPSSYVRAGIFPWGKRGQKGPDNEKVVSARAIEHIRELTSMAKNSETRPAILLMCGRGDVKGFRANGAACPSFARYLEEAQRAGVRVLCHAIRWGEGDDEGKAFDAGALDLWQALGEGDEFIAKQ